MAARFDAEDLKLMSTPDLEAVREDIMLQMKSVQGQLASWNDGALLGGYDEEWATRARSANLWMEKELLMVKAEFRRRADEGKSGLPKTRSEAFCNLAKEMLPPEERKRIWEKAEERFPHLWRR